MGERTYQKVQSPAVAAPLSTALALRSEAYATAEEFSTGLRDWRSHGAHLLTPVTYVQAPMPMHGYQLTIVQIDKSPIVKEIYHDVRWPQDQYALTHSGLKRLWSAAGGTWTASDRVDNGKTPYVVEMQATGCVKDLEGEWHQAIKRSGLDYRKDSPQVTSWTEKQLNEGRRKIIERCESLAQNRVIRELLIVRDSYSIAELDRPFVLAKLVVRPDMNDPMQKRMLLEHGLRGSSALYAGPKVSARLFSELEEDAVYSENPELPPPDVPDDLKPSDDTQEKLLDFKAITPGEQEDYLLAMVQRKGYDSSRVGGTGGIIKMAPADRVAFLQYLLAQPDKIATP